MNGMHLAFHCLAERARLAASLFSIISYILLIQGTVGWGVVLNLICQILIVPFALKHKAYDMVSLSAFFGGIDIHQIIQAMY